MSDIEEMDSDRLNELESILYASIHYNDDTSELQPQVLDIDMEMDARNMPPPLQQREQQLQRIVSNKLVINNATAKPRYWTEVKSAAAAPISYAAQPETSRNTSVEAATTDETSSVSEQAKQQQQQPPPSAPVNASPKNNRTEQSNGNAKKATAPQQQPKVLNPVQRLLQQQQQQKRQPPKRQPQAQKAPKPKLAKTDDEPERFDQRLLVAIPHNCPKLKREPVQSDVGPFGKANRKLDQFQKLAGKRQKSKRAQANKKQKQIKEQPIDFVDLVESEISSDTDDVVLVPLPPVPIIEVDASDEEQEDKQQKAEPYLEENAMDAGDIQLGVDCGTEAVNTEVLALYSPCNSVLSSDDFIVQKDTTRLLADRARATDEDLLVLTENAIRNAAEPGNQAEGEQADNSSEYEFVPPSRLEEIKQNYRVDDQQFRALDVYESESDLTESGIYCKAKQKATPTIIRNVDSASDSTDIELLVEDNVTKTKRLRKRRASSTNQSQSDPNNEGDKFNDDTDSDGGVQATGVPGIARGMAVERCKRKIVRVSQRRSSESAVTKQLRQVTEEEASSESDAQQSLPTAREIAERLLKQEQEPSLQPDSDEPMESIGSDANTEDEAEMQNAISERISAVFERIDENTQRCKQNEYYLDAPQPPEESTSKPETQEDIAEQQNFELEAVDNNSDNNSDPEEEPEEDMFSIVRVEHNVAELEEPLRGGDLVGWNDEMCRFYNDSWHGEQFNVNKILKSMNAQRHEWKITSADRFPAARKRSNLKCTNCFEMGHIRARCPRPRKPVTCFTCGMTGHAEPRCPNAICLGCGSKQELYVQKCNKCSFHARIVCNLCKMRGHSTDMCPDKWRRYHSTTRSNELLESNVQYRVKHCSYCGARGHLFEECRQRIGEFRNTNYSSHIVSHQKVYKDRSGPVSYLTDLCSFFAINTSFHFKWSSEFPKYSSYARFLKAVGLARAPDKRNTNASKPSLAVQRMLYTNDYEPNPLVRAALGKVAKTSSVSIVELPTENKAKAVAEEQPKANSASLQIQQKEITSNFQSKPDEAKSSAKPKSNVATAVSKPNVPLHDVDSDSNYSFSEHFEVPSSTTMSNEIEPGRTKSRPMETQPDMIPLSSVDDDEDEDFDISSNNNQGISMCVNNKATSASTPSMSQPESLPDLPSEAKMLMARDQIEYLFSAEGRQFLTDSAKQCNVNVRMDFKEYGYVLVIYGLKKNQEELQLMLLRRNQEVRRKSSDFQSQKPPKRTDVLIRFIRDGIKSLTGDLGNAKGHYFRIKELERMNTKNGYKSAEKKRRLLNMILFGQAGLNNGKMHLDQLLLILKRLLDDCAPEENATPEMRKEIEEHWRIIFSSHPHPNYDSLLQSYAKLDVKNRLPGLNIELMLGQQPARKSQPAPPPPPVWQQDLPPTNNNAIKNRSPKQRALQGAKWADQQTPLPPVWKAEERTPPMSAVQQQKKSSNNNNGNNRPPKQRALPNAKSQNPQRQRQLPPPPVWRHDDHSYNNNNNNNNSNKNRPPKQRANPYVRSLPQAMPCNNLQQRVPNNLKLHRNSPHQSECVRLLDGIEKDSPSNINTDAYKPSVFWSRESLKYLDELFKKTKDSDTLERLNRVLERSQRGQLSHIDYRAVIRLHSIAERNELK